MPTRRTARRRNPSSFVGERIREAIQFMRAEAHDLRKKADDIEDAWGQHDYADLRDVGVITQSQYADIMAEAAAHTTSSGGMSERERELRALGMSEDFIAEVMGRKNPRRRRTVARRRR
jgi:hypothetical protein